VPGAVEISFAKDCWFRESDAQRSLIKGIATELGVDILDCAAALVYLTQETAAIEICSTMGAKGRKNSRCLKPFSQH